MRLHRFFIDNPLAVGQSVTLSETVWRHCVQVLRYSCGDELLLFNGDGRDYQARLTDVGKKIAIAQIVGQVKVENESPLYIHLLQGIARGDKMDLIIQKAVELGVNEFTPMFSEYCNVKLDAKRLAKKLSHWQQVAISACEQSGRAIVPKLNEPVHIEQIDCQVTPVLILSPKARQSLKELAIDKKLTLLIGPEGGLSDAEVSQLIERGAQDVRIGPRVLRTETAGLAAISALQAIHGDW